MRRAAVAMIQGKGGPATARVMLTFQTDQRDLLLTFQTALLTFQIAASLLAFQKTKREDQAGARPMRGRVQGEGGYRMAW